MSDPLPGGGHAALTTPLVRRARSLLVAFSELGPFAYNFLTKQSTVVTSAGFDVLHAADQWSAPDALVAAGGAGTAETIDLLIAGGCLVVAGTPGAARDDEYATTWAWEATAGLYHFSLKNTHYIPPLLAAAVLHERAAIKPPVPLYYSNDGCRDRVELAPPDLSRGVLSVLCRRRSERLFRRDPLSLDVLRDCLFAGLGIVGVIDTPDTGPLPLKLAPSAGARNPYEAYVYALRVAGLQPGIYHYSGIDNSLGLTTLGYPATPGDLLTGQEWANDAAAIIFLVAHFERSMWKYEHPTGYRVVLIEAGHIGQNIATVGAEHDVVVVPTTAVADNLLDSLLTSGALTQTVVYALVLGNRLPPDHYPPPDVRGLVRPHGPVRRESPPSP